MKLYRNAIILVVIVALLVGAYFVISNNKPAGESTTKTDIVRLVNVISTDIASVTLENPDGTFVIKPKGTEWELASPADLRYDPSVLSSIVVNSSSVVADKVVDENPKDLAIYGLDKPKKMTVTDKSGKSTTLEIGSLTPTKGAYYVKTSDKNTVYTVSTYSGDFMVTGRNGMRLKTPYTVTPDIITSLSMERDGQSLFAAEKDSKGTDWTLTSPIKGSANSSALSPMLEALSSVTIFNFIEEKPSDLSQYGLDKPAYVFDFNTTTAGAFKLELGDEKIKGSEIYAKLSGSDEVFTIDSSKFTFLDKPLKEIVNVFAYLVNIDQVNTIDLKMDGNTTHMTIETYKDAEGKSDADKDKFTVNGKDASGKDKDDNQPFRTFYQALIGVTLDDVDLNSSPADVNPDVTIDYALKTGTMKVEYVSRDANYYYVFRNGEYAHILVKKSKVDYGIIGMKNSYKTMMDFLASQGK
ncbi:MAG TPA: DUF4340 domain-containing protein [Clostridia bacterium]|nr:DUF4340 domain-containing protein [Clostridia bacterium]